jgi:AraC-like DNA-binding protein
MVAFEKWEFRKRMRDLGLLDNYEFSSFIQLDEMLGGNTQLAFDLCNNHGGERIYIPKKQHIRAAIALLAKLEYSPQEVADRLGASKRTIERIYKETE